MKGSPDSHLEPICVALLEAVIVQLTDERSEVAVLERSREKVLLHCVTQ